MIINSKDMHFQVLNEQIREANDADITIENCNGQRYIGSGLDGKNITIQGTPGNALGAYLNGGNITVQGNTQDATGDTMNSGNIYIYGCSGDATGYAMRGGKIFVRDDTGYRAGIHMKAYEEKKPVLVIGGKAGSFLGEYQAGGIIIVLGLNEQNRSPVGRFCGTGMHGGKIYLRCDTLPEDLPEQVLASEATPEDMAEIRDLIEEFCTEFSYSMDKIMEKKFYVLVPNSKNPYKQLYTYN